MLYKFFFSMIYNGITHSQEYCRISFRRNRTLILTHLKVNENSGYMNFGPVPNADRVSTLDESSKGISDQTII